MIINNPMMYVCFSISGRENRDLDLLLFREVYENISKVDRVLTTPGGSLLLAGRSGVGRRSATLLVANMHGMTMFTPKVSRGYTVKQFKNDLKAVSQFGELLFFLIINDHVIYRKFGENVFYVSCHCDVKNLSILCMKSSFS